MQFHIKTVIFLVVVTIFANADEELKLQGKTIEMLNRGFKTFLISRGSAKLEGVDMLKYEFPPQGLHTDSVQNMSGVAFYLDAKGKLILARPIIAQILLPDQKEMNAAINSEEIASDIFARYRLDELNEIQAYGLLSKWAIAILARNDGVKVKLKITDKQKSKINKLFDRRIQFPDDLGSGENGGDKVGGYAKKIIQFAPY